MVNSNVVRAPSPSPQSPGLDLAPARFLALGLGVAVALWLLWFGLHVPGLDLAPVVLGPIVLIGWIFGSIVGARLARPGLVGAALAGLVTSGVSLMALGSVLTEQPDPGLFTQGEAPLHPAAPVMVLGFLAAGGVIGALGALFSGTASPRPSLPDPVADPWASRLALVVACSYLPLVSVGGFVTSTESGMAVTGWPDTFGANMFLYPISLMSQPRVFVEHAHRLFGMLAGLGTVLLWVQIMCSSGLRRKFGIAVTALLLAVIVQGVLGGKRVLANNAYIGAVHGAFGQVVLAYAYLLALWMAPRYRSFVPGMPALTGVRTKAIRVLTTAALHSSLLQLLLGSLFRHLRRVDNPGANHVIYTHMALAFVVVVLAILAASALMKFVREHRERVLPVAGRVHALAALILVTIGVQFMLGWMALIAVMSAEDRPAVPTADQLEAAAPVPVGEVLIATAHQFNGAIYLLILMLAWGWARRFDKAARPVALKTVMAPPHASATPGQPANSAR